jgi:beta-mannosidase
VDLGGQWLLAISSDDLRRDALTVRNNDLPLRPQSTNPFPSAASTSEQPGWHTATVPGHWHNEPGFAGAHGPMLYQRNFRIDPPELGRRRWLLIDGIFSEGDLWLDGAYLGDLEGYAQIHSFEITQLSALDSDHHLLIEVSSPPQSPSAPQRTLTGAFQGWPGIDSEWNPGGIPGPITIRDTGPVSIQSLRVLSRDADEVRAHLILNLTLDADAIRRIRLRTLVNGRALAETEHLLAAGPNEVAWNLDVPEPELWWPRHHGAQALSEITVEVLHEGRLSDHAVRSTGFREVAWDQWICSINGRRIFLKGANLLPTRLDIANASESQIHADLQRAVDAGLDMVRLHSHIAPDYLYTLADQMGIVILQDLGLRARYARSVRNRALAHTRAVVDRLGHHPSIVMWSGHNDPSGQDQHRAMRHRKLPGRMSDQLRGQLPSWNRTVLDRFVKRAVEQADPTRPCVPNSGVAPHLPLLEGSDNHLWLGWTHGHPQDLAAHARRIPRQVRFVSEFGAQAVPDADEFIEKQNWPKLDWDLLRERHGAEVEILLTRFPPGDYPSFDSWRKATQLHQAELIGTYVETLRRLKYRPTGGFCLFSLNSPAPLISHAVVDHLGGTTLGYEALRKACAPVLPIADRLHDPLNPGSRHSLRVHVVSDLGSDVKDARLSAEISGHPDKWVFQGDVPADGCVPIGRVTFFTPPGIDELEIHLNVEAEGPSGPISATNSYRYAISRS